MSIASFAEIQLPTDVSQGATGGPRFSTSMITLSSGSEHRNINWSQARGEWDVAKGLQTQAQVEALLAFFNNRYGRGVGFRFKDWVDYRCPRWDSTPGDMGPIPTLFTTNGTTSTFQLVKVYSDTLMAYTRIIYKPVPGSLVLYNNGVLTADWTVDTTTGIVTLGATTTATTGHAITGHFEFDVPARFDTDDMKVSVTTTEIYSWSSIPVVEIRLP